MTKLTTGFLNPTLVVGKVFYIHKIKSFILFLPTRYPNLIDNAIRGVLKRRGREQIPKGLTPQDVFYREVGQ